MARKISWPIDPMESEAGYYGWILRDGEPNTRHVPAGATSCSALNPTFESASKELNFCLPQPGAIDEDL
jgi:hypothetical protein